MQLLTVENQQAKEGSEAVLCQSLAGCATAKPTNGLANPGLVFDDLPKPQGGWEGQSFCRSIPCSGERCCTTPPHTLTSHGIQSFTIDHPAITRLDGELCMLRQTIPLRNIPHDRRSDGALINL